MNRATDVDVFLLCFAVILSNAISLVCFHVVQESGGIDGNSTEADSIFSLGILSLGAGKIRPAPLHRQQRDWSPARQPWSPSRSVRWPPTPWRVCDLNWTNVYLLVLLVISMFPQIAIAGPVWSLLDHSIGSIPIKVWSRRMSRFLCRSRFGSSRLFFAKCP